MKATVLQDIVRFREDRLFDGAIDVEWLIEDRDKARRAAEAFVFHGPAYHGVSQQDVGTEHGHKLVDSATFVQKIIQRSNGAEDRPFTLAIAGYGTGKSHLAVTLAILLSEPAGESADKILANIEAADASIGKSVRRDLRELGGPALVVSLNGMSNFEMASEFTRQIMHQLHIGGVDSRALDELRPRFKMAANLVQYMPATESTTLSSQCGVSAKDDLIEKLKQHDEVVYGKVYEYFAEKGIPIKAIGDETVKDVLETVCQEYCGEGKPFRRVVVLFDEFGRYAEFATVRSQVAGSGVLQHLFEGIQSNSLKATFVGFIQFDLNTYVQRMAQEFRNEILRVSTRYQSADKAYLSINLETLIANLLEKEDPDTLSAHFDSSQSRQHSVEIATRMHTWFPRTNNHRLWCDVDQFHQVIRKGCWPLSPYSSWFLFHLAAGGQHLQQRSALALLGEAFKRNKEREIANLSWEMAVVDLWSDSLQAELLTAEESGTLGTITHAYANVIARSGHQFSEEERRLLKATVLASKLGLNVRDRVDAVAALAALAGLAMPTSNECIEKLEGDYNVISWDPSFRQFEILGDAASRPQFLSFLRNRVNSTYNEMAKAQLFVRRGVEWGSSLLSDQTCDFAEQNRVTTTEWRFEHSLANLDELDQVLVISSQDWISAYAVDKARGHIIFCYVEPSRDLEKIKLDVAKLLRDQSRVLGLEALPVLVVLLYDEKGELGQCMAELSILSDTLDEKDKARFGNLVGAHQEKCVGLFVAGLEALIKARHYVTAFRETIGAQRLGLVCSEMFERIYPKVLSFPFDGFSTAKGNAADSCMGLTSELLNGSLDYHTIMGKPIKEKNRALEVLNNTWKIFNKDGDVSRRPAHEIARAVLQQWENQVADKGGLPSLGEAVKKACSPPFGANIASAGLLLGVFIRARKNDFSVMVKGQPTDFANIIGDGLFRGKFLDLNKLDSVSLAVATQEGISEWQALLDDWERASSYKEQIELLNRAYGLQKRLQVPAAQAYRYEHLRTLAEGALKRMRELEKSADDALSRIEHGSRKDDVRIMTFGGALLKEIQDKMRDDPMWDSESAARYETDIEDMRQRTIQAFDQWLHSQTPVGRTTKDIADFERAMIVETGRNLKKLGLDQLHEKLKQHVDGMVRNVNNAADALELANRVSMWLTENESEKMLRIAELRSQREAARAYTQQLATLSRKISLPELETTKTRLAQFVDKISLREKEIVKRASQLWECPFTVENSESLLQEAGDLQQIYEGCDADVADLRLMRRALHLYSDSRAQLSSDLLTDADVETLAGALKQKAITELGSDEPPWKPEETLDVIVNHVKDGRGVLSRQWVDEIRPILETVNDMSISDANSLFNKLSAPPAYLSTLQRKELSTFLGKVETRLNKIKIEWLVAKYRELEESSRKEFLKQIGISG